MNYIVASLISVTMAFSIQLFGIDRGFAWRFDVERTNFGTVVLLTTPEKILGLLAKGPTLIALLVVSGLTFGWAAILIGLASLPMGTLLSIFVIPMNGARGENVRAVRGILSFFVIALAIFSIALCQNMELLT